MEKLVCSDYNDIDRDRDRRHLTDPDEPFSCVDPAATCIWNSHLTLVSCVTSPGTKVAPYSVNCVDHDVVPTSSNIEVW